jgi:hypothetical protein
MPRLCNQVLKDLMVSWLLNEEAAPQQDSDIFLNVLVSFCQQAGMRFRGLAAKFGSHKSSIQLNSDLRLCV